MFSKPVEQLAGWISEAVRRQASNVLFMPEEPVVYRTRDGIERDTGDVLATSDIERLAEAVFDRSRLRRLGRKKGVIDARVRLPDGGFASLTAARAGGEITLVARPVRPVRVDCRQINVPESIVRAAESRSGLLIVTGPPGSGKTTTCYALLEHLNARRPVQIVTVGYHIDYVLEPKRALIQERQVGVDVPDMSAGVQSAVLQGADVLFVGEIRDLDVLQACLRAAEMNCLVIVQLHLPTPQAVIERMIAVPPEESRVALSKALAHTLRGILAQSLLATPNGPMIAAYGALVPDDDIRRRIVEGGGGLDDRCDPRLESDIQSLRDEGKAQPASAAAALEVLAFRSANGQ